MSMIANRLGNRLRQCLPALKSVASVRSLSTISSGSHVKSAAPRFVGMTQIKSSYSTGADDLTKKFDGLVKDKNIVVFMKGTPDAPQCGFSKAVCGILQAHGASFESYNVLADESIRQGIKEYTEWPTIPQVFFNGEFIGGCDILLEMHRSGDIVDELKAVGVESKLAEAEDKNDEKK